RSVPACGQGCCSAPAVPPRRPRPVADHHLRSAPTMRFPVLHRLLVVLALLATASPAAAAKKPKGDDKPHHGRKPPAAAPAAGAASSEKPFTEWSKLTKDAEKSAGFFTLWKKRDNLYLEIPKNQLDQPFLYVVSMARGIGSNFVLGGLPIDDRMLQFE